MTLIRSLLAVGALSVGVLTARAQLIAYESFNYTVGSNVAGSTLSGVGSWTALNATSTRPTVASGNLSVSGLAASTGQSVSMPGGNYEEAILGLGTSVNTGSLYYSLMLNLSSAPTGASYILGFATGNTNYGAVIYTQATTGGYQIGIANRSSGAPITYDTTVYTTGTTLFLVARYDYITGTTNDTSSLWINPSSATFAAGAAPSATVTSTGGTDMTALSQFLLRGASGSPVSLVDELRIGTTWASVTPAAASPVPEPSTYAAIFGAIALGGVMWRRSRSKA